MRSVNLMDPRVRALAQSLSQPQMAPDSGGWFQAPPDGTNKQMDSGLKALAMQAAEYQKQKELAQMYAAPGVATAQSGP